MNDLIWHRPIARCGESSHCPEVAVDKETGLIYLRSSARPDEIISFTGEEWVIFILNSRELSSE